jgi:glycosyltransferase involved in cell wall biosynthesis
MKILLSAFAYAPNVGSEPGVGWRWAAELGKRHEVTVVTDITRRALVEAEGIQVPDNVEVVYYRPAWLRVMPLNSTTAQVLYTLWQFGLLGFARRLHRDRRFDLAIHITYSVFRHPSFLGYLGIPFVFGPLGGGEDAPFRLKRSIKGREKIKEILRTLLNKLALIDPFLWAAYSRATLILVSTDFTRRALPWPYRRRAKVYSNLGLDLKLDAQPAIRQAGQPLKVLFVGRLLGWKGGHFAIRAVANLKRRNLPIEFTLVGDGPYGIELRRVAQEEGIEDSIDWIPHIPQAKLFDLYKSMHCFLFPSLHDSGGSVVLEAQAYGLPVICLDLGGPATLVRPETAWVVNTYGLDEDAVVLELAGALEHLLHNESLRFSMAEAAIAYAQNMNWTERVEGALQLLGAPRT